MHHQFTALLFTTMLLLKTTTSFVQSLTSPFHFQLIRRSPSRSRFPAFTAPNPTPFRPFSTSTPFRLFSSNSNTPNSHPSTNDSLSGQYSPSIEKPIYQWWESSSSFTPPTTPKPNSSPYVIPMPPPNVTGRLHMGHAIFVALQDIMARFHRMRGRDVLWLPGTDHAGIATQLQVEKLLAESGQTRESVGREEFLKHVWAYKNEQGGFITSQLRALGASADWSRERFTMDDELSKSVTEAFIQLHDKGLIYRGEYMVNWAPKLKTAVSDLEVDYREELGKLFYFKYVLEGEDNNNGEFIPVATTRPETIIGDTAVCVHPDDSRYKHLIGKSVKVPMSSRTIPIIADDYVDMEFGTGALKITPGHDVNDYAIGKRYNLPVVNIMNKDATINNYDGNAYAGLDRFVAREKIWEDIENENLAIKVEDHKQRVPISQRGGEVIEPLVSKQWFVKTAGMGAKALDAVKEGEIEIIPKRFEKVWYNWLEDIHDWCISRQLWWGHRIPVYYVLERGEEVGFVVARNLEEAGEIATEKGFTEFELKQDDDVLDTWFSSGIWPFATVGWPNEGADDYKRFYPAACLETGYDILFFWVARMAMMGIELTGQSPFKTVYMHGLVRAADGSKMSKTKGNVVDPLQTVEEFGADSLRYSLVTGVTPGQDIPLNMDKIESNRNFANKVWNVASFIVNNALKDVARDSDDWNDLASNSKSHCVENFESLPVFERWIISKCHDLVIAVTDDIEKYNFGAAGSRIYEFLWDDFADWYVEISKTRLYEGLKLKGEVFNLEGAKSSQKVLVYVLDVVLKSLHPFMPFVTEHLYHHLPTRGENENKMLMLAKWPIQHGEDSTMLKRDEGAVSEFELFRKMVKSIRNARAEYNAEQGKKIEAVVVVRGEGRVKAVQKELGSLILLAKISEETVRVVNMESEEGRLELGRDGVVKLVVDVGCEVVLPLQGLIDFEKEKVRLENSLSKLEKEGEKLKGRLESGGFVGKAPENVVQKVREELEGIENQITKIRTSLAKLS